MTRQARLALPLLLVGLPALAQQQPPATPPDQAVVMRSTLDALRANTEALGRSATVMDTFANRLERLESATRGVPPSLEGLRTDIIAIRAALERIATGAGQRRAPATLKFNAFSCGNEGEANCAQTACKSVGYAKGLAITATRTGTGAQQRTVSVDEATCYD